jgi:hypothetical protein
MELCTPERGLRHVGFSGKIGKHVIDQSITGHVEGFGCRPITGRAPARGPASESLQRTKPRGEQHPARAASYGEFY